MGRRPRPSRRKPRRRLRQSTPLRTWLRRSWERHRLLVQVGASFLFWVGLFAGWTLFGTVEPVVDLLVEGLARGAAWILTLFGQAAQTDGALVHAGGFSLRIIPACSGLLPTLLFLAAVFAYPSRWREKAVGFAVGVPGIFGVNLLRVVSLFFVGDHFPRVFEQAHLLVWQPLIIVSAVAFWLLWVTRWTHPATVEERRDGPSSA